MTTTADVLARLAARIRTLETMRVQHPWNPFFLAPRVVTADETLDARDLVILGDATAAAVNLTLPAAGTSHGYGYYVKKIDLGGNLVTLLPTGANKIDGAASYDLDKPYDAILIVCDGVANWYTFALVP